MNRIMLKSMCLLASAALVAGCGGKKKAADVEAEAERAAAVEDSLRQTKAAETIATLGEEPVFDIVTNYGTIKVRLYSKTPKHRENFEKLALTGYYDGTLFHRVISGFMIQAGDPTTRDTSAAAVAKYGSGGPDYTVPAEFVPEYRHKKGALAAARRGDAANPMKESSGSQFYLVQDEAACSHLDGEYTVYGETIEGLDIIDRIAAVETNPRDVPLSEVKILRVVLDPEQN